MKIPSEQIREELSDLICRELSGELSPKEKARLLRLRQDYLPETADYSAIVYRLRQRQEFDGLKAYNKFCRLRKRHKQHLYRIVLRCGISVAATVFIAIGIWLFMKSEKQHPIVAEQPKVETEMIAPGKSKAFITLATGEKIELGKVKQNLQETNGTIVTLDSAEVKYKGNLNAGPLVYHTLTIPVGGEYHLVLADGSEVWMNADSELKYPVSFIGEQREVFLKGEAYFEVSKDREHPFIVHTSRGAVKVLGTGFNVRDYQEESKVVTTLVEGQVAYQSKERPESEVILRPGFQVEDGGNTNLQPKKVDVMMYVGWKDGKYIFENTTLEEIMQVLSKWYDIEVLYKREGTKYLHFTGDLERYNQVNDFLRFMELGGNVRFQVKGKTVIIE